MAGMKEQSHTRGLHWQEHCNKEILFLEDVSLINSLISTRFNMYDISKIEFPFDTVMIALPRDFKIMGASISGLMVSFFEKNSDLAQRGQAFVERCWKGGPVPIFKSVSKTNERTIAISYVIDNEKGNHGESIYNRGMLTEDRIKKILSLEGDELIEYMNHSMKRVSRNNLNDKERMIQGHLMRLIISLLVYIQSFGYDKVIQPGLPQNKAPKSLQIDKAFRDGAFSRIKNSFPREVASQTRSAHFRQLSHPRYYQGEHANKEPGSRIIYVSEYLVGIDGATPETVIKIKDS